MLEAGIRLTDYWGTWFTHRGKMLGTNIPVCIEMTGDLLVARALDPTVSSRTIQLNVFLTDVEIRCQAQNPAVARPYLTFRGRMPEIPAPACALTCRKHHVCEVWTNAV